MSSGTAALAAAAIVGGLLAGCTGVGDTAAAGADTSSRSSATAPSTPSPSSPIPDDPSATATGPGAAGGDGGVTISGMVEAGVEPNCLLLRSSGGTEYLLIGGDRSKLQVGQEVTVRGQSDPDLLSICQQGVPLRVQEIQTG
ncbi:MAG: hypothetical protein HKP61_10500 [Dactylosporangium sp.]|nr:hypothetical protein [Dactylosporangium sp.]